ncbi:MAG: ATP-binding protein [Syntrophales bacterium]|nr:ATP-binding protein [Syntrophales bacterium]
MRIKKRFWAGIFSWFIIGAVIIFAPLFIVMTMQNLGTQKEQTTRLLLEKGDALIRSFEAGARTGEGLRWSAFELQKLLIETAQQPGVDYIIVVDTSGAILADSDPVRIGEIYGTDLDLNGLSKTKEIAWRQMPNAEGADTFEVYRQFAPTKEPFAAFQKNRSPRASAGLVIFVGLDMGPVLGARKAEEQRTIWMSIILLLIGCSGVVSLFLAYRYRTTRASLSRIRAFSDHLVENMPFGLVALDNRGRIAAFNTVASSILELPLAEVLGRPADQFLPAACTNLLVELKAGRGVISREMDCPVHKRRIVPLEVVASILEEEGEVLGSIVLFRDMTEMQALRKEVLRSQRLAALGNLAAGVAHEIRNPLSSIKGFATYFKERYRDIPEDKKIAEIMVSEVERLNRVISQLLEFARPMTLNRRRSSLAYLISHTIGLMEDQARKAGIVLQADEIADAELFVDPDKIKQVFLNLFLNAVAAMEGGGTLRIATARADSGRIAVIISDTGGGIKKEDLNRIFDPYFTTKASGTGLGLPIALKIMEAHDGEIRIESEQGKGTTVTLTLPLYVQDEKGLQK